MARFTRPDTRGTFAASFPEAAAAIVTRIGSAAKKEIAKRELTYLRALTPVGGSLSRDRHPGLMKRSWRTLRPADDTPAPAVIINETPYIAAPYAAIIDRGRKRGFTIRGEKRQRRRFKGLKLRRKSKGVPMLGSKQAPQGVRKPAYERIVSEGDQIAEIALLAGERL